MTPEELRLQIANLIERSDDVSFEEIDKIMRVAVASEPKRFKNGWVYKISGTFPLLVTDPNDANGKLPAYALKDFRDRMIDLKLYE
jgi:hypothetical protein